ncbi:hypothetical protein ABEU86_06265 [Pseudomonas paraversuta]|uniref:hypothetical protein n=1 Tax=Pseudomonas paraversuta TaxID=2750624 RepID=UPI003D2D727C
MGFYKATVKSWDLQYGLAWSNSPAPSIGGFLASFMKRIEHYTPPPASALARLKDDLGFTSAQMADLAELIQGAQWRKYTGSGEPRLLTLNDDELALVVAAMCEQGATVEIGLLPAGPHSGLTSDFSSR